MCWCSSLAPLRNCKHVEDHREELEVLGFPIPSSLRHTGFSTCLTALGIERGRLVQLYKQGDDTAAYTLLLLHGASLLEGAGDGKASFWCAESDRGIVDEMRTMRRAYVDGPGPRASALAVHS